MKDFYITTSIMYASASPHIGFALELLQADAIARYKKLFENRKVFFLTGSDDHGIKIAQRAKEDNMNYQGFVNKNVNLIKKLIKEADICSNDFIQTSDKKRHYPAVIKAWNKLVENGDIYKKKYIGYYCIGCETFLAKKDLIDGKCLIHYKEPEKIEEENYFFRLSKYLPEIKKTIEGGKIDVSDRYKKDVLNTIKELEDISFSRAKDKMKWGIPVPSDNSQLIYVWGDALINYLSAIDYLNEGEEFEKWPADVQIIGKDIFKFHMIFWLGILMSLKLPLPKRFFIHGFILDADGRKMSKSLGNTVDPFSLIEKYGSDAFRYLLLKEIHPVQDSSFSLEKIEKTYNADLVKGLGNLISRVLTLVERGDFLFDKVEASNDVQKVIEESFLEFKANMENFEFNQAILKINFMINFANQYIDLNKPWQKTENQEKYLYSLLLIFINFVKMLYVVMPITAEKILNQINVKQEDLKFTEAEKIFDFSVCKIKKGANLFNDLIT